MKSILVLLALVTLAPAATGDFLFQKKTSTGYEPVLLTPENGKIISWSGGAPVNTTVASSWADITSKPTTLTGFGITDGLTTTVAASTYQPIIGTGTLALSKLATDPLARANHTGTQAHTTITGLGTAATTNTGTTTGTVPLLGGGGALSVAMGGTGATTPAAALVNFGSYIANVRHFGALGNGSTDDTAAINAAAFSISTTGGVLYFPKGVYRTRKSTSAELAWGAETPGNLADDGVRPHFKVFPNCIMRGDGMDVTIIRKSDTPDIGPIIHFNEGNIVFEDFTLDGNNSIENPLNMGDSELFDMKADANMLWWNRVKMVNSQDEGIDLDRELWNPSQITSWVTNCVFKNLRGNGIHNANWMVVRDSVFEDVGNQRLSNNVNVINGSEGNAAIDTAGEKLLVSGCHFLRVSRAIHDYREPYANTLGNASALVSMSGQPTNGDTLTIGAVTYTFMTSATDARHILIGATRQITARNAADTILGTATNGAIGTITDPLVYAIVTENSTLSTSTIRLIARLPGLAGNSITVSELASNLTVTGMTGGGARTPEFVTVENCNIEDVRGYAMTFQSNSSVRNCRFRVNQIAISSATSVDGCFIEMTDNLASAKAISGALSATNNVIVGGNIEISVNNSVAIGNRVTSAYGGIILSGASLSNCTVIGNRVVTTGLTVAGAAGTEPPIDCSTAGQTGHVIVGNDVTGGNNGIRAQANSIISGNRCSGAGFNSIVLTGTGNTCTGNSTAQTILNTGVSNTIANNVGTGLAYNLSRSGTPEGVVTAPIGSTCMDTATGSLYRKTSGASNTGWVTQ